MKNELIKFAPLFAGLTDEERELLASGFVEGECAAQAALLQAGERSDAIYLIDQGFVSLSTPNGANLATLGQGSLLGETSFLSNAPQDINAVALSDVSYWKLTDQRLRELIVQEPSIGLKLGRNFGGQLAQMGDYLAQRLGQVPELAALPSHTLQAVAARLQAREIKAQEAVFRAGDAPLGLFLVERGSIELRSETQADGEQSTTLQPGMLFGGLALLTGKPYAQSAVATEPTLLWVMSMDAFTAVSGKHPGLRRSLARKTRMRLGKSDQSQAVLRLAQIPIFADAPPQAMQAIAQRMVLQHVPAGERVYMVGESGDALYIIEQGEVELTGENASGVIEELARVTSDGYFGEMSLLTGQIRAEDATAIRNTNLWVLYKSDLDELAAQHPEIGKALSQGLAARLSTEESSQDEEHFRKFALLAELSAAELNQITQHLQPMRYRAGEQIYRATSPADMLYLLEQGQVRIQPYSGGSWLLGDGDAFGERSLLSDQPHNATALAETDVDVWTLSKQDFDTLMNRYPSLAISMSRMLSERLSTSGEQGGFEDAGFDDQPGERGYAEPGYDEEGYGDRPYDPMSYTTEGMTNMPSRRRRQSAVSDPAGQQAPRRRGGLGQWFSDLSTLGKVQLAVLVLLLIWLIGIAAPFALMSIMQGASVARGAEMAARTNLMSAINAVYAVGSYELASQDKELAEALAMADQAVPPTATYTPGPTQTPIPTATPLPTSTPTPRPTATNPPPTPQPVVRQAAPPQAEPTSEPEAVAAAAAPRAWDPRLDQLGVHVEEANVEPGQPYWRLVEAYWANEQESGGKHHIYVEVLDENGDRIVDQPVTVWWGSGSHTAGTEDKAAPDYGYNYQMYAAGNAYNVQVEGLPSDTLRGAGMGDIERPMYGIHTSYYLTYQRVTK